MSRYFITTRDSSTGLKFQEIEKRSDECYEAARSLVIKYGFTQWQKLPFHPWGGVGAFGKPENIPDSKIWSHRKKHDDYFPKKSSKVGKTLIVEIEALPKISNNELNSCVSLSTTPFRRIGCDFGNKTHYGFTTHEDWDFTPPADCTELTLPQYKEMFPSQKNPV